MFTAPDKTAQAPVRVGFGRRRGPSKPLPVISRRKAENFAKVSLATVLQAGYNLQT